jgi:methanethiol S-methyltransferase
VRELLKIGAATAVFAALHSLLASRPAKDLAARILGERERDAGYRLFYNVQAVATFAPLLAYGSRLPKRTLYRVNGPAAGLLRTGQAAGLLWAFWAAGEVGILRLVGVRNLWAYLRDEPVPSDPAAQGPEREGRDGLTTGGPFRWSRHPLNLAPLPVFWLTPHLTTRRLAFNVVGTAYLVLGSLHEERRLVALYGTDYEAYRRSGVPFFLPWRPSPAAA